MVAIAIYLQFLGILDYRALVSHLPAGANSGPWGVYATYEADVCLGTLNYHRSTTALYLIMMALVMITFKRRSNLTLVQYIAITGGILPTGSRSGLVGLIVCLGLLSYYQKQILKLVPLVVSFLAIIVATGAGFHGIIYSGMGNEDSEEPPIARILWLSGLEADVHIEERERLQELSVKNLGIIGHAIGRGFGSVADESEAFVQAHGQIFNTYAQTGIIGSIVFWLFYFRLFNLSCREEEGRKIAVPFIVFILLNSLWNDILLPTAGMGLLLPIIFLVLGVCSRIRVSNAKYMYAG